MNNNSIRQSCERLTKTTSTTRIVHVHVQQVRENVIVWSSWMQACRVYGVNISQVVQSTNGWPYCVVHCGECASTCSVRISSCIFIVYHFIVSCFRSVCCLFFKFLMCCLHPFRIETPGFVSLCSTLLHLGSFLLIVRLQNMLVISGV